MMVPDYDGSRKVLFTRSLTAIRSQANNLKSHTFCNFSSFAEIQACTWRPELYSHNHIRPRARVLLADRGRPSPPPSGHRGLFLSGIRQVAEIS